MADEATSCTPRHRRRNAIKGNELSEADRALARKFGYKPVFEREFGYLSSFSFAVSISGLFSTVAVTFNYPLAAGGSASAVWCWFISGAGCMCIALSVAEIVSAYPTCGGLYYSVSRMTPKEWVPSISWVTGWLCLLGQVAGIASSEWGASTLLLAAVSMATDGAYSPIINQTVGVMAGLTMITGLVNSLSTYWMEKITKGYVVFHVIALLSCCIALLVQAHTGNGTEVHSAKYVLTDIQNTSGWTPAGWSFLFGFLSASWTMTGMRRTLHFQTRSRFAKCMMSDFDATAHISEEIIQLEIKALWAISLAMLFTYIAGWLYNIVLCFTMGDPISILASPLAQPVAQIFRNVLGKTGGIVYTLAAFVILKFVTFTAMQALARTIFAFSRDRLLPFSSVWTKVLPLTGTPIYAVWIAVACCVAINLVGLGSYIAIAGVFNVCAIALDWSYCIPIVCKLIFRRFEPGPWHMGSIGLFVNVWPCVWTVFITIIFLMPTALPTTPGTMNYAVVYFVGILVFSALYWFLQGRKFYTGPLVEEGTIDREPLAPEAGTESGRGVQGSVGRADEEEKRKDVGDLA